ncbi:AMP-binding protein [Mycolicibacterium duvalii]|uniref:AMP-binding protein n=1 Tax=Mycolicibacterium duvalii TaxID=39688 RepID=A0A7I7K250_9MYCO|nr:class I adenylate-forming enzyme family protein [Mycolicibacterium duvalii]MCV7370495.1 acyl--CoA ligase [Mycolicibacterium duvalii]PEG37417.1 AMP-binding protein [Mycolicibacterium duvalii]BBX17658.1 AMP-binding protein [Mycolicibacterium duvalii]
MTSQAATLVEVWRACRNLGDKPLLVCDEDRLSYRDAEIRSAALAHRLIGLGAGKGTHVGLWYPNGSGFVVAMLAAARIGAVVVPFSTFATGTELRAQLRAADVAIMLSTRAFRGHDYIERMSAALDLPAAEFGSDTPMFTSAAPVLRWALFDADADPTTPRCDHTRLAGLEDDVDAADRLAIIYTSGSTGAPKGAVHTHGALVTHQQNLNEIRGLDGSDVLFCNSPFFWIGGFAFGLLATLTAGATLACSNAEDAGATLDLIEAEKPTMTNGFVSSVARLTEHPSYPRRVFTATRGNLYPIMAASARPADAGLRHGMLGMTEAGSVVLLSGDETDQPEHRRGSFGRPAPGMETRIVDPATTAPVPAGAVGELWLRGPFLMQHYYGRSREECFDADGWLHTGDLVRTDDDGFFYFVARAGAMIKTAGANVTPGEVEAALSRLLPAAEVHVVGLPDPQRGEIVAAVVAFDDAPEFDEDAVRTALRRELSAYKVPRRFTVCRRADLPLLASGKVDLSAVKAMFDG